MAHNGKADTPELSRDSHPAQPVDSTMLSAVIAMIALSVSKHGDRCKEAPDVFHRKYCTNGSRHPRWGAQPVHTSEEVHGTVARDLSKREYVISQWDVRGDLAPRGSLTGGRAGPRRALRLR